ncbi:MAG: LuxR C-terminal-related transcriptional regulator [Synergistaceae bacterium]|jgi:LuxR family maltose regulon positive regulatory protein|nr:LuxR C-terminal-related transcriptional regulator [Synergistaceae bacterium]
MMRNRVLYRDLNIVPENRTYLERPRLKKLFAAGMKSRVVTVIAGAGFGKTSEVYSFLQGYESNTMWIQLSEMDNQPSRLWENFVHTLFLLNEHLAARLSEMGFPDTDEKFAKYLSISGDEMIFAEKHVIVFDDFHLLHEKSVLRFFERAMSYPSPFPNMTSVLISRKEPNINIVGLISKGRVFNVSEDDLRLTESETAQYFQLFNIPLSSQSVSNIYSDTEGWVLATHLVGLSLKKSPSREQSARIAMKLNIFKMIESEVFQEISEKLQRFLIKLSLIDHLSVELVTVLAGDDEALLEEMDKISSFVRHDVYLQAYLIHHLFLDYLKKKQDILTEEERRGVYLKAAKWCGDNDYKMDAVSYYEKCGEYEAIVDTVYYHLPIQVPYNQAQFVFDIYERAPVEELEKIVIYHAQRARILMSLNRYEEAIADCEARIAKYSRLPSSAFTNRILCTEYTVLGVARYLTAPRTDRYDFDALFEKADFYYQLSPYPVSGPVTSVGLDAWASKVGTARNGAMEEYIEALSRSVPHVNNVLNGMMYGLDDLAKGELQFYRGDFKNAVLLLNQALRKAQERNQHEIRNRVLFYLLRIGIAQGDYEKIQKLFRGLEAQLDVKEYLSRYTSFDIVSSWYFSVMRQPQLTANWISGDFVKGSLGTFEESFGNFVRTKLFYSNKRYDEVLSFLENERALGAVLFGRLEMKALEAVCLYQNKNRDAALIAFKDAYDMAAPNGLSMPFTEMGNDMRTMTRVAMRYPDAGIPREWLEQINRKAATYAKRLNWVVSEYKKANNLGKDVHLSQREIEILYDAYHGLSRSEIAVSHDLSVSTVKMALSSIYSKLGADNIADVIRIALERKLIA